PARPARLLRPPRRVEPDVDALDETARKPHVVVLEEREPAGESRVARELPDLADQPLAALVGRMRLAGEDDANRSLLRPHELREPFGVGEQQPGALVRREPPREADRQHVIGVVEPLTPRARGRNVEQLALPELVDPPQLFV